MAEGTFINPQIVEEEVDILIIGGGMAACGTAFEIGRWNESAGLKIKLVDKAALDHPAPWRRVCPRSTPIAASTIRPTTCA